MPYQRGGVQHARLEWLLQKRERESSLLDGWLSCEEDTERVYCCCPTNDANEISVPHPPIALKFLVYGTD